MEKNTPSKKAENTERLPPSPGRFFSAPSGQIVLGAAIWTVAVAFALSASSLPGNDPYYHVAIVQKMLDAGNWTVSEFPWTTCSIWSKPFFDKEWLFHVFLLPFVSLGGLAGAKTATIVLAGLAALSWGFLLRTLDCRRILQGLLFAVSATGYVFLARIDLCRPHLASLIFLPLTLALAIRGWRWGVALSTCLYALFYVAAWHVVPILVFLNILQFWKRKSSGGAETRLPLTSLWAFAGIAAGFVLSPYFPDNIRGVFIQTILILKEKWFSSGGSAPGLAVKELAPIPLDRFWLHALPLTALAASIVSAFKRRRELKISPTTTLLLALAAGYALMAIFSRRFVEYSAPACAVAAFVFWERHPAAWWTRLAAEKKRILSISATVMMLAILAVSALALRNDLRKHRPDVPFRDAAEWMRSNMAPGDVVFSSDWGANAVLFYQLPDMKYLVMLDPYFMRAYSKRKHVLWWKLSQGRIETPADFIEKEFNAKVVFLPPGAKALAGSLLMDSNAELEVEGKDGEMVFLLRNGKVENKRIER